MADPRLNSMHLDPLRREEFRKARDELLSARGEKTLAAQRIDPTPTPFHEVKERIQRLQGKIPPGTGFVLMDRDHVFPLKVGFNTVGRLTDNDVVVEDPYVSRRHCAILVHANSRCELHDVASKNGTFLNGKKLAGPHALVPGDEVRMCDRQFIFMSGSDLRLPPRNEPTQSESA
jgi:pSer/pThr/pTyr-binding forkhead associated (FHA) protein